MVETAAAPNGHHLRRWIPSAFTFASTQKILLIAFWMVFLFTVFYWQRDRDAAPGSGLLVFRRALPPSPSLQMPRLRPAAFNLTDFGGVGDGATLNTAAFESAIMAISKLGKNGGGQLNVPPGNWLTAPFNLTSHMTLFLAEDAVILGIDDEKHWPLMPPLPSYGYGREHPGPRYGSLIHGQNLKDVVITGHNGTINGQGQTWWKKYRRKLLNHTRGPLVQIMWSSDIIISNVTLRDSPFWPFIRTTVRM
ncbi:probable polygalacturonase [Phtheirospermum japonicum]|uniref:Probable polygalacturonase n=1 Tax=Phtheirospermum japonicum TaxID=374723 RepID=A0A830B3C2_9LAMI|nr:probable polygalacturonase [Phtheirospermum japonicum]